jgi:hypothetical protein
MISSIHVPIQILVLDILDESLQIVRNYENELLPMIHQNWHGVVRKFDVDWIRLTEAQKLVASKTVDV